MKITEIKRWHSVPIEKCRLCAKTCVQRVILPSGFSETDVFPLCEEHFLLWISGSQDLETKRDYKWKMEEQKKFERMR